MGTKNLPKFSTIELVVDDVVLIKKYYYTVIGSSPITLETPIREDIPIATRCQVFRNRVKPPKESRPKLMRLLGEKTYSKEEQEKVLRNLLTYMFEPLIKEKAESMAKAHAKRICSSEEKEKTHT